MSLIIDTITQNKSVFNPQTDLNATGTYGIWDLTKASITYNNLPALPKPVCISSAIIKTLYFVHNSLTFVKYPLSGIITPFSP